MKILHVLYSGLGGHGSVFFSMVNADRKHKYDYEAVFNGIEEIRNEYIERCTALNIPYTFIKKRPGKHFVFFYRLFKAIRKADPEIIFLHGSIAVPVAFAAKLLSSKRSKIIVRETQAMHMKTGPEKAALKLSMLLADKIVFLSNQYQQDVKQNIGWLYRHNKIMVIPNGIDLSLFCPGLSKQHNKELTLGMQSRLVAIKDHITLFAAIGLLKNKYPAVNVKLFIAGDGEYRNVLEQAVDELHLRGTIIFTGTLDEKKLPTFLQSLDIYIHASLGETMSTAIMQAMACGLPIIASDVAGINNMVENEVNGLLVPAKNEIKLAAVLEELISNLTKREQLAEGALIFAKNNFSNLIMFERYNQAFLS